MPANKNTDVRRVSLRLRRQVFLASVAAVLVMSLAPAGVELPTTGWDKTNHLAGFAVLAILGNWAYGSRTTTVMAALLAYGALIEVLQSFTTYRTAEWGDLLADAMGIALGWGLTRLPLGEDRTTASGASADRGDG